MKTHFDDVKFTIALLGPDRAITAGIEFIRSGNGQAAATCFETAAVYYRQAEDWDALAKAKIWRNIAARLENAPVTSAKSV